MSDEAGLREVIPPLRWMMVLFVLLGVGATAALYFGTTHTEDDFSWTIQPPLTAALLGAGYSGTIVLFGLAIRERWWANARMVVPAPFTLSTLLLIATLLHLDKFHFDSSAIPTSVTWIWLVVYVVVPPGLVVLTVLQLRAPGGDPPRARPVPGGLRAAVLVYAVLALVGGLVLFLVPEDVAPHWPWAITPLTGRAIAAWLTALGVAALQATWENDLRRVRIGMAALAAVGTLGLVAVARYPDDIDNWWPGGWLLVAVLAFMAGAGGYGMLRERRTVVR